MNRLNLKKYAIAIIVISIFCLLLVILFVVKKNNDAESFFEDVSIIDQNIASGFYNQAEKQLSELYDRINSSSFALSFLKRTERIASEVGDYSDFIDYASGLHSRYKNNLELSAVYAYSEYMNGNYKKAFSISEAKLAKSDYNFIYLASLLKENRKVSDRKVYELIPSGFRLFFRNEGLGYEELITASKIIKDDRLIVDAALLLMGRGEKEEAWDIISSAQAPNNLPAMFIAYDNRKYGAAERYYTELSPSEKNRSAIEMFGADIYLETCSLEAAEAVYNKILNDNPGYSWIPYRNLYSLKTGTAAGIAHLEDGLKLFPGQQDLLLPLAWETYISTGLGESAASLSNPEENEPLSELFRINVILKNRSPEHIIGNYWNIINRAPDSEVIAQSFANYLLRNRNFKQLELLLKKYTDFNGETAWQLLYSAVSALMQGDAAASKEYIDRSLKIDETTASLYNKGVISHFSGNKAEAVFWLKRASATAEMNNKPEYLMKIYYKLAETYYNNLEYGEAEKYVKKSLRIAPDDMRSSILYNKIKEGHNDKT
ncbi:MAG: hypothetical protein JEZ04_02310 [Spirochaetales bacterium]|nr:hypothetical protein [Spirochaetales bacterium]